MLNTRGLQLDQTPPIGAPLRFFLSAPLFLLFSALVFGWQGETILGSRWSPGALALTHWIAIGFLGQIMAGALIQMLPVIAGAPVPAVCSLAFLLHLLLFLGSTLLGLGFLLGWPQLLFLGALASALGFLLLLGGVGLALIHQKGSGRRIRGLWLAASSLFLVLSLGLLLAAALNGWVLLPAFQTLVTIHLTWAFLGWVGLLIAGIAFQLIPMFYVTPAYPEGVKASFAPFVFATLALGSLWLWFHPSLDPRIAFGLPVLAWMGFSGMTLFLQSRRKRVHRDTTLLHWWVALASGIGAGGLWMWDGSPILIGLLLLFGLGPGLTAGMLFKIVPFLSWFHLRRQQIALGRLDVRIPNMYAFLPESWARVQWAAQSIALVLLVLAWVSPRWIPWAALALGLSAGLLEGLMIGSMVRFYRVARALSQPKPL